MRKTEIVSKKILQGIASHVAVRCRQCEWENHDLSTGDRLAREHVRDTSHEVVVESAFCYVLRPMKVRKKTPESSRLDMLKQGFRQKNHHVVSLLKQLSPREQTMLSLHYSLADETPHTFESIGRKFGVTRECIQKIEKKALLKLDSFLECLPVPRILH